jgi:lauroyl/myristoyl acyltransferase
MMASPVQWLSRQIVDGLYYGSMSHFPMIAPQLAAGTAQLLSRFAPDLMRIVRQNVRLALGPLAPEDSVRRTALIVVRRMQDSIRDTLLASETSSAGLAARVTSFRGHEHYHEARSRGRGVLMASAHMGSFEPCLALLRRYEPRIHVLFQTDPMPRFERARSRMRQSIGVIEHRIGDGIGAWILLQDALKRGEAVVIHADRAIYRGAGARMRFLGSDDAVLPTGPVRLALACGAAILPTFCTHAESGLHVEMHSPIVFPEQPLRAAEVPGHPAQAALVTVMERAIRQTPDQWLAFWQVLEGSA